VVGAYRAGTFAVRTDLCRRVGGYLNGLGTIHQFELFMRLQEAADPQGLRIEATDTNVLDIDRRAVDDRRSGSPHIIHDATSWVLERHPVRFATAPEQVAAFEGVRGHAAARAGDWKAARRHLWRSVRLRSCSGPPATASNAPGAAATTSCSSSGAPTGPPPASTSRSTAWAG
jgi:hypothetical protein